MQTHPEVNSSHKELYAHALGLAQMAEDTGFDSLWISEHHFLPDGYCPSPLLVASAMASATKRIRVGTSALILPLHNPIRVAEDAAVADNISGGRLDLGVALGYRKEEYDGLGVPMRERPSRMEEGIEVLLRCWAEGSFSYYGRRYRIEGINVTPKPVQRPIPILIGAFEEPAIRRAGRLGYPLLIGPGRTVDMVTRTLSVYNDAAREAGRDPSRVEHVLIRETYVHRDPKRAREGAERYIIKMYKYYFSLGVKMYVRGRELQSLSDPMFELLPEDRFVVGTPEECAKELRRLRDELGISYVATRMVFPEAPQDVIEESVRLFGEEVIPMVNSQNRD
jgi:probable F420-dependent oxidoreductase